MSAPWRAGLRRLLGLLVRRRDLIERDADNELASHLEARVEQLMAAGMSPEEARAEALRRLGGSVDAARTGLRLSAERRERVIGRREWFIDFGTDLRYALRGLRREPVFSAFAVFTLALGIGANAAMFGIVDKLLLRGPAHVRDASRVVRLYWTMRQASGVEETNAGFDQPLYANLQVDLRAFSGLARYTIPSTGTRIGEGNAVRLISSASATANFMSVLGASPAAGRFFTMDEQETTPLVAVLGYELWQTDFGGDETIVGRTIKLSDRTYTVVGIAPRGFTGAELDRVDVWFPLRAPTNAAAKHWTRSHSWGPRTVARLAPGATFDEAAAEATRIHRQSYDADEHSYAEGRLSVGPLHFGPTGVESTEASISRWLVGVSVVVLLVACANLVNLLLARAVRRRREMAVRLALGAGRARLMRLLLASSLLLSSLGAVGALGVAFIMGNVVRRVLMPDVDWTSGPVDGRVLVFSLVVALASGIVIGVLPAWRAGRGDASAALKAGVREGGGNRSVVRSALTVAQASLAMLLLVGAGLFVRSLSRVRGLDLGIQPDRVVLVAPRWAPIAAQASAADRSAEQQRRTDLARVFVERLAAAPQVEHAALTIGLPFGNAMSVSLRVPGWDSLPRLPADGASGPGISAVSADYFATVGTRLLQGRSFTNADRAGSEPVAIVSASMAATLWPGRAAVGQCIRVGGDANPCSRVVGVVQDARRGQIREERSMHYYVPLGQEVSIGGTQIVVRPRGDAALALPAIRAAVRQIDPSVRYVDATVLQDRVEPQMRSWRLGAMMFTLFAALALAVASVGMFGVVAYLVEQRRHEIGVRVALGAQGRHVVALMLRGAVATTAAGVALGAGIALLGGRFVEPLLFDTSAHDPAIIGSVATLLVLVACVASGVPALRARAVDPMTVLQDD